MTATLNRTFQTYCPECDADVCATLEGRRESLVIRGELTEYDADVAICPKCGCEIGDSRIESINLERAYSAYRAAHGIMGPEEIHQLRTEYGLSLREFSKYLGFGEQTVARYEAGGMPDKTHNATLNLAKTPDGARMLLSATKNNLSEKTVKAVERFIMGAETREQTRGFWETIRWPQESALAPNANNGFRGTDPVRVEALVQHLARSCRNLFKTKLQKAMFFCDRMAFELNTRSLTGLQYAHAPYGPVMNEKDTILLLLQQKGSIELVQDENDWGEIVQTRDAVSNVFNDDELRIIDTVAKFVNTFETAKSLSDFSHSLSAWSETSDGELIPYTKFVGEVSKAIEHRMGTQLEGACTDAR